MATSQPEQNLEDLSLEDNEPPFKLLGTGSFGRVYTLPGSNYVWKKARQVENNTQILINDFAKLIHMGRHMALVNKEVEVFVPRVHDLYNPLYKDQPQLVSESGGDFYNSNNPRFPAHDRAISAILIMTRIWPIPELFRNKLIDAFCPEEAVDVAKSSILNKNSLIRVLMGLRLPTCTAPMHSFTLYHFPFTLDRMEKMDVKLTELAKLLARALAILHMKACVDCHDIEVVIGCHSREADTAVDTVNNSRLLDTTSSIFHFGTASEGGSSSDTTNQRLAANIKVFIMDCNQVADFQKEQEDVAQLVHAFCTNEPYFPRPHVDAELWKAFSEEYIDWCSQIGPLEGRLGTMFIIEVQNWFERSGKYLR